MSRHTFATDHTVYAMVLDRQGLDVLRIIETRK